MGLKTVCYLYAKNASPMREAPRGGATLKPQLSPVRVGAFFYPNTRNTGNRPA